LSFGFTLNAMTHVDKILKNSLEISGNRFWSSKTGKFQRKKNKKSVVTRKGKKGERKLQEAVESKRRDITSFIERCVARKQVIIYIIKKYYNIEIV